MPEREIVLAALAIGDEAARRDYIDGACGGDADLRERVDRLLESGVNWDDNGSDLSSTQVAPPLDSSETIGATASQTGVGAATPVDGVLFSRYRIERVLGKGGMGIVYLAEDLRLGRMVAIKTPRFSDDQDDLIERFRREARTMASVMHRNLCPVFDVDEADGTHYLTMAFIDGQSLAHIIKHRRFGSRQIAKLIQKLALALAEAHRAGIIHRDLKPANVMIDSSGEPILMDFGLAWMVHGSDAHVTQTGAIIGTPAYMSPEQAEGDAAMVGETSDIYSLGAILYELLTGRRMHTGGTAQVLLKLVRDAPTPPHEVRPDVDPLLEEICCKAISRYPKDRYQTARAFAAALERFSNAEPAETQTLRNGVAGPTDVDDGNESIRDSAIAVIAPPSPNLRRKTQAAVLGCLLIGFVAVVLTIATNRSQTSDEVASRSASPSPSLDADEDVENTAPTEFETPADGLTLIEVLTSPDWKWSLAENMGPEVNSEDDEVSPNFTNGGRRIWFHRGFENDADRAWITERSRRGRPWSQARTVGRPFPFDGPLADTFMSSDEKTWLFVTWDYDVDLSQHLYQSTRASIQTAWSPPELIAEAGAGSQFPVLSSDGLTLYTTNSRQRDALLVRTRSRTSEPWSRPKVVEGPLSEFDGVRASWLSSDSRVLLFHSIHDSFVAENYDLWLTTRKSTSSQWERPIRLGSNLNSPANEITAKLSDDGREIIFASDRPDGFGAGDLYIARRVPK